MSGESEFSLFWPSVSKVTRSTPNTGNGRYGPVANGLAQLLLLRLSPQTMGSIVISIPITIINHALIVMATYFTRLCFV